jgi:hypothetical protein
MPRRHPRIYSQPKPAEDALADIERLLHEPDNASIDEMPQRQRPSIDCRPLVAVIAIVIFSLALIAFRGRARNCRRSHAVRARQVTAKRNPMKKSKVLPGEARSRMSMRVLATAEINIAIGLFFSIG